MYGKSLIYFIFLCSVIQFAACATFACDGLECLLFLCESLALKATLCLQSILAPKKAGDRVLSDVFFFFHHMLKNVTLPRDKVVISVNTCSGQAPVSH